MSSTRFRFASFSRLVSSLSLLAVLISGATSANAKQVQPEDVIAAEIQAQDSEQWGQLPEHWVTQEQASLREFFANNDNRIALRGYFDIQSARLAGLKELAAKDVAPFVDIVQYQEQYQNVRVFYAAIDYTVAQEDRYHYNGINYRLMVVVRENSTWRLAEMSEAPVEAVVAAGKGFGTKNEDDAIKVRKARVKGDIINAKGEKLGKNADETAVVAAANPVPPATIYVRMTKSANLVWYGCNRECIIGLTFQTSYVRNVLPNEWSDQNFPAEALKAGAMAVKHYGWYRVLNAKYPGQGFDVYDDTRDQAYIAGTAKTWSNTAVDAVYTIGMKRSTSGDIFQAQHIKGTCICDGGQAGGKVLQLGSWFQARDRGRDYQGILRYYYDGTSSNLGGQTITFFSY